MFTPGQAVQFTFDGLAIYRSGREQVTYLRSATLDDIARICGEPATGNVERYALVRYADGSEAVYEEAYLEAA